MDIPPISPQGKLLFSQVTSHLSRGSTPLSTSTSQSSPSSFINSSELSSSLMEYSQDSTEILPTVQSLRELSPAYGFLYAYS